MLAITLNPGFVLMIAALLVMGAPRSLRAPIIAAAALASLWLLLDHDFGAAAAVAQMGLPVVLLDLDALNRIFGIALQIATIALAIFANARRHRFEDGAVLLMGGAAISALFVGDLVSFVAAAALASLSAAWIVFCSPIEGASRAGVRLLVWNGLEGLLLLVGVAFHLSSGAQASVFARMEVLTMGGAFIFAALLIRLGAPLAHVWVKDTIAHASPLGGAALAAFSTILGVYALARFFPAEPLLLYAGGGMIVVGAIFAMAVDDLRAAGAYAQLMQTGVCAALIGVGSPLAMAAAEAHAFAAILAFVALQMALGAIVLRRGDARVSNFEGLAQAMPVSSALLLGAGLAVSAAPGVALFTTLTVGQEATEQWELRWLWTLLTAAPAATFVSLVLRPMLAAHRRGAKPAPFHEAPFSMLLGVGVALFFSLSIGLAPNWLYGLLPTVLTFTPYALDNVAPQLALLGSAGLVFVLLRLIGLTARERAVSVLDVDAFYRGPVTSAGRWAGVVLLRVYGAWQDALARLASRGGAALGAWARSCDRPYRRRAWEATQMLAVAVVLALIFVGARTG